MRHPRVGRDPGCRGRPPCARDRAATLGGADERGLHPDNLLDRLSDPATLAEQYERGKRRERELLDRHLGLDRRRRDLDRLRLAPRPPPAARAAVAARRVGHRRRPHARRRRAGRRRRGRRRRGRRARRARRRVLRRRPAPPRPAPRRLRRPARARACARRTGCCAPAARSSRSSRTSFTPSAPALALANRAGLGVKVHGTPDDIPLSPRRLARRRARGRAAARSCTPSATRGGGCRGAAQRAVGALDRFGSAPGLRWAGHTFMLIARKRGRVALCTSRRASPSGPATSTFQRRPARHDVAARSSRARSSARSAAAGSATSPCWRT